MKVHLHEHEGKKAPRCPFCHDELAEGDKWTCPACSTVHHAECAKENGRCAELGCRGMPRTRRRRRAQGSRVSGTIVLLALTGLAALAYGTTHPANAAAAAFFWAVLFAYFFLPRAVLALINRLG